MAFIIKRPIKVATKLTMALASLMFCIERELSCDDSCPDNILQPEWPDVSFGILRSSSGLFAMLFNKARMELSTAVFEGAVMRILELSTAKARQTIGVAVDVFPVPGGP
uniref:Uncharacterized protein n=1 Tax=Romanomermis culicivorax TaxID=13658 RepID=A0A915KXI1_ROMCU